MAEAKAKRRKFLTLADIEKAADRPITEAEVPELGGWFRIRPLAARTWERIQAEARLPDGELDELIVKRLAFAEAIVDANGDPLFTLEEVDKLLDKSVMAVERLAALVVSATLASVLDETKEEAALHQEATDSFPAGDGGSEVDGG